MTMPTTAAADAPRLQRSSRRRRLRLEATALAALLVFGCATVRTSAGSFTNDLSAGTGLLASPQVELLLEDGEPVRGPFPETAQAEAQRVLAEELAAYDLPLEAIDAADPILVAREQAAVRTPGRKNAQIAAGVALAVGIVFVVIAVIAAAAGDKGGSHGGSHATSKAPSASGGGSRGGAGSVAVRGGGRAGVRPPGVRAGGGLGGVLAGGASGRVGVRPRGGPSIAPGASPRSLPGPEGRHLAPPAPAPPRAIPGGGWHGARPGVWSRSRPGRWRAGRPGWGWAPHWGGWQGGIWIDGETLYSDPLAPPGPGAPPDGGWPEGLGPDGLSDEAPPPDAGPEEAGPGEVAPVPAPPLELPVPPELPLDDRGFFSGEQTVVRLDLLDRATGKPLWSGEGTRSIDPRDREAVRALLDELLSDSPWALPAPASPSP